MVEIELDGKKVEVPEGSMVMHAAEKAGTYIPHFCYHKKLSIAANCRMCLVDVEKAPKAMPACATPVAQGMVVHTKTDKAIKQSQFLLTVLVHKNNPDIVSDPIDAPAEFTRETMQKRALEERVEAIASSALAQGSTHGKLEESMLSTKATLMKQNIVLQEMEGIEKQL